MCAAYGKVMAAEVVDHVEPHGGDWNRFYTGRLQSLCKSCHDAGKRWVETRGYDPRPIGSDGWPLDPNHPANRRSSG
jgi:hypothetical protein